MSKTLCPYTKSCPVYKGSGDTGGVPLVIYRNVFCLRGLKGWNNCKEYTKNQEIKITNDG